MSNSNSDAQKNHLLSLFVTANKNKNHYIKLEAVTKKDFLEFVGEDLATTSIEVDGLTKTYTHGMLENIE